MKWKGEWGGGDEVVRNGRGDGDGMGLLRNVNKKCQKGEWKGTQQLDVTEMGKGDILTGEEGQRMGRNDR